MSRVPEGMKSQFETLLLLIEQMLLPSEGQPQLFAMVDPLSLEPAVYVEAHLPTACCVVGRAISTSTANVSETTPTLPMANIFVSPQMACIAAPSNLLKTGMQRCSACTLVRTRVYISTVKQVTS